MKWLVPPEPTLERLRRESGNRALPRNSRDRLGDIAQERQLRGQVHETGNVRRQPPPEVDGSERVVADRPKPTLVIVRQELGLVGRQIDRHRALGLAALARQAQVERLFDFLAAPAIPDNLALGHLPQQVGATAGRVLFLAGYPKARAHDAAFVVSARAYSDAAQGGVCQAAVILRKLEMRGRAPGMVVGAEPEIFVDAVRLDDFPRIHLPIRVPGVLEFV